MMMMTTTTTMMMMMMMWEHILKILETLEILKNPTSPKHVHNSDILKLPKNSKKLSAVFTFPPSFSIPSALNFACAVKMQF